MPPLNRARERSVPLTVVYRAPILLGTLLLLVGAGALYLWHHAATATRADFTFINRGDNKSLDPNTMSWLQDIRLAYALWEGLYSLDPVTLKPIPGCADPIEISLDQTVYTFHIRPQARWTNGDPVTAADFVFAWRRMLEHPGDYTYLLFYIRGAQPYESAFAAGASPNFNTVGIRSPDPGTLVVTLEHPVTFFPSLCAFPPYFPLNERSMQPFAETEESTGRTIYNERFTRPPNLQTNGPYQMIEWTFKRRIRLRANPYYWDAAHVQSKIIDQIYADDELTAYLQYDDGQIDWLSEVSGDLAAELKQKERKDLHVFPGFGTYFYSVNCQPAFANGKPNPLTDIRVRRALALAIDKRPIVQTITRMGEPIATTYIPRGIFPDYPSPAGQLYDVTQAQKLLADAGYPNGKGFPPLTILINSEQSLHSQIAQIVQHQWRNNLHLDFSLTSTELKILGDRLRTKDYAIARASWIGDYDDPSTFTDKYLSNSDNNDSGWLNPQYDSFCHDAAYERDPARRLKLLAQAENLLLDEAPIIPIFNYVNVYMFRDNVHGVATDPRNMVMFKSISAGR
jgi:oligopeptide transport system substrate-binding protein